jgi:uncharacterized protein (DUF2164 family)
MSEEMLDELESELLDEKERTFEEFQEMLQVGCKEDSMKVEYFNKGIEKALEMIRKYRQRARA